MAKSISVPGINRLFILLVVALYMPLSAMARRPVWARKATNFPVRCFADSSKECKTLRIFSPDRRSSIEISYREVSVDGGDHIKTAYLEVVANGAGGTEIGWGGSVEGEILWSPDSSALFINGSDGGEGPEYVTVYRVGDLTSRFLKVREAQNDMVKTFPPCRAKNSNPRDCALLADEPDDINVNAIAWTRGSSAIVVVAQMPCSSRFGEIWCQVMSYELDVASGKILRRIDARELAAHWRHHMAWHFQIPNPTEYEGN